MPDLSHEKPLGLTPTPMELRDWTPAQLEANIRLMERLTFGASIGPEGGQLVDGFKRDAHGRPIEKGYGAPGRETENHFLAIRKYEGHEAEKAARAAAAARKASPLSEIAHSGSPDIQAMIDAAVKAALEADRATRKQVRAASDDPMLKKPKRPMSPEHKAKLQAGRAAAQARRLAAAEAQPVPAPAAGT